jgi:hypothetical protein
VILVNRLLFFSIVVVALCLGICAPTRAQENEAQQQAFLIRLNLPITENVNTRFLTALKQITKKVGQAKKRPILNFPPAMSSLAVAVLFLIRRNWPNCSSANNFINLKLLPTFPNQSKATRCLSQWLAKTSSWPKTR